MNALNEFYTMSIEKTLDKLNNQPTIESDCKICNDVRKQLRGFPESKLDGDNGLAAATMRGFDAFLIRIEWNTPESAPKDGSQILADVGLPWAVVAVWNSHDEKWVYPSLQACDMVNNTEDTYFENEQERTIKAWLPLPKLP